MYRKEIDKFEGEISNDRKIIEEYKQICKNYQNPKGPPFGFFQNQNFVDLKN